MSLQFKRARLERIGGRTAFADRQWATLSIGFLNDELEHFHDVEVRVIVSKQPNVTIAQIEEQARQSALEVLNAAVSTLSTNSISELEQGQAELEDQ